MQKDEAFYFLSDTASWKNIPLYPKATYFLEGGILPLMRKRLFEATWTSVFHSDLHQTLFFNHFHFQKKPEFQTYFLNLHFNPMTDKGNGKVGVLSDAFLL